MRKTIKDGLSGSSPTRSRYLRERIERSLAAFDLSAVELRLDSDPDDGAVRAQLRLSPRGGASVVVSAQRRSLPAALEEVFEAGGYRLRFGIPYRRSPRRRGQLAGGPTA